MKVFAVAMGFHQEYVKSYVLLFNLLLLPAMC